MKKNALIILLMLSLLPFNAAQAALHTRDSMPDFIGTENWKGDAPTRENLAGYTTIMAFIHPSDPRAWLKFKILTLWHKKYFADGVRVIVLITPKYDTGNEAVEFMKKLQRMKFFYPVGRDPSGLTFRAYNPQEGNWVFFIGKKGRIRHVPDEFEPFAEQEEHLRAILKEVEPDLTEPIKKYPATRLPKLETIDLGYKKIQRLGNPYQQIYADIAKKFTSPEEKREGFFYLTGKWKFSEDYASNTQTGASVEFLWDGRPLSLIATANRDISAPVEITVDGSPLIDKKLRGSHVIKQAGKSFVLVKSPSLYEITRKLPGGPHLLKLNLPGTDIRLYRIILSED